VLVIGLNIRYLLSRADRHVVGAHIERAGAICEITVYIDIAHQIQYAGT